MPKVWDRLEEEYRVRIIRGTRGEPIPDEQTDELSDDWGFATRLASIESLFSSFAALLGRLEQMITDCMATVRKDLQAMIKRRSETEVYEQGRIAGIHEAAAQVPGIGVCGGCQSVTGAMFIVGGLCEDCRQGEADDE